MAARSNRIAIIGGKRHTIDRALMQGLAPILIQHPLRVDGDVLKLVPQSYITDYENDDSFIDFLATIHRKSPLIAVMSLTEYGLLPAARASEALGLRGLSPAVVERTRDKLLMRKALAEVVPVEAAMVHSAEDVRSFSRRVGWPVILKPRDGVGSIDIRFLRDEEELRKVSFAGKSYLAEEFLVGREFSIEAFSFDGQHMIAGINEETNAEKNVFTEFLEIAHQMPADLPEEDREAIGAFVRRVLDGLGITDGPTHTEIILTKDGPRLIETHTRIAGDHLTDLVQMTTGIDLIGLSVAWAARRISAAASVPYHRQGAAIRYFTPPPGRVKYVSGVTPWRALPGVVDISLPVEVGSSIKPVHRADDRVGYVMAVAPTSSEAASICRRVVDGISILVE